MPQLIDAIKANDEYAARELLLEFPELARERGDGGESAVLLATYYGKRDLAAQIAQHVVLDLCEAAALNNVDRVNVLINDGANLDSRSYDGWTALHLAAFLGNVHAAQLLITAGAELDAISSNSTANTPLCAALAGSANVAVLQLLIDSGADVNATVAHELRPLHLAASRGVIDVIHLLLNAGADKHVVMRDGVTPADMARARGHDAAAQLLS